MDWKLDFMLRLSCVLWRYFKLLMHEVEMMTAYGNTEVNFNKQLKIHTEGGKKVAAKLNGKKSYRDYASVVH